MTTALEILSNYVTSKDAVFDGMYLQGHSFHSLWPTRTIGEILAQVALTRMEVNGSGGCCPWCWVFSLCVDCPYGATLGNCRLEGSNYIKYIAPLLDSPTLDKLDQLLTLAKRRLAEASK